MQFIAPITKLHKRQICIIQKKLADLFPVRPEQSASVLHSQPHLFSNFPTAAFRSITQHAAPATGFSRLPPEPTAGRSAGAHRTDALDGDIFSDEERYFSFSFSLSYFLGVSCTGSRQASTRYQYALPELGLDFIPRIQKTSTHFGLIFAPTLSGGLLDRFHPLMVSGAASWCSWRHVRGLREEQENRASVLCVYLHEKCNTGPGLT